MTSENFKFPKFPEWNDLKELDNTGLFWDDQDISNLNTALIKTIIALRSISNELTKYEKKKREVDLALKRKFRSEFLQSTADNSTIRKMLAEVACEELEWKSAYLDEIIKELVKDSNRLRTELDILKTLGHNLRQEMRL